MQMRQWIDEQKVRLGLPLEDSHSEFARLVGVNRETVSRWYNTGQLPRPKTARAIAVRLGVRPEEVPQHRGGVRRSEALLQESLATEVAALREEIQALAGELRDLEGRLRPPVRRAAARQSRRPNGGAD